MLEYLTKRDLKLCVIRALPKGFVLFHEGDTCNTVCMVLKGQVVIKSYSNQGNEILYNIIHPNEFFGNNLIFSKDNVYMGNVEVTKDSKILVISKHAFLDILKNNSIFLQKYLEEVSHHSIKQTIRIKSLSFDKIEDRLFYYLSTNNNKVFIKSISHLSKELNVSREALSRLIHKLQKEKIISYEDNLIQKL